MALRANALTSVAAVQAVTGLSAITTAVAERLINAASGYLETAMGRKLYYEAGIVEKAAGYGDVFLSVSRVPLVSITEISYAGSVISSDDYEIHNADAGLIYFPNGTTWTAPEQGGVISSIAVPGMERRRYTVTYSGGWVTPPQGGTITLPADIEEACIQLVVSGYRRDGYDQSIKSEQVMSVSVSYREEGTPQMVKDVIERYRFIV